MVKQGTEYDRGDIARAISETTGIDEADVLDVLKALPHLLASALCEFGRVEIRDLGTFTLATRAASKGHNFATGETMEIPEHKKVKFKSAPVVRHIISERTGSATV